MSKFVSRFLKNESGATAIEYGLIAALLAVIIVAVMTTLNTGLGTAFSNLSTKLTTPPDLTAD
jgi:pilus assembly protein Flp/PilA